MKRITPHYLALPPLPPEYLIILAICHVREPGGTPTSHIAFRAKPAAPQDRSLRESGFRLDPRIMPGTPQSRCCERHPACRNLPVRVAGLHFCLKTLRASSAAVFLCAKLRRTGGTTSDAMLEVGVPHP